MIQNDDRSVWPLARENVVLINGVPPFPYIHTPWDGTPNPVHPVMHVPPGEERM